MTCTASYTVTGRDVGRGYIANTAEASGRSGEETVVSPPSSVNLPLGGEVGLALDKQVDDSEPYALGDEVEYSYVVSNVTDNPVEDLLIHDDLLEDVTCESTALAEQGTPGDSTTCTGTYVVDEDDVERGAW